jgi:hypothetical protein
LEERSNGKGKLAEASEEGQGPRRAIEPIMMMMTMMMAMLRQFLVFIVLPKSRKQISLICFLSILNISQPKYGFHFILDTLYNAFLSTQKFAVKN